jgi:hypothetical protein
MGAQPFDNIRFTSELLTRPPLRAFDVVTKLGHFAIVTYAVEPWRVRPHVHPRFDLDCFRAADGTERVWVSMVPFEDQDFHFGFAPWAKFCFGQTNYRTYVLDRVTGRRAVWFFGTTLDSFSVAIPRYLWGLPWHRGRIGFDCTFDQENKCYTRYRMRTHSSWAPVAVELEDTGQPVQKLEGAAALDAGLVVLTHPLLGVYYRNDGQLGTYHIWHDRLHLSVGRCIHVRIGLFDRLGIVPFADQKRPHSVLLQSSTEFTIYLPPGLLKGAACGSPHPAGPGS